MKEFESPEPAPQLVTFRVENRDEGLPPTLPRNASRFTSLLTRTGRANSVAIDFAASMGSPNAARATFFEHAALQEARSSAVQIDPLAMTLKDVVISLQSFILRHYAKKINDTPTVGTFFRLCVLTFSK